MYSTYDPYYDSYSYQEKKPLNLGVVASTLVGGGTGLVLPAYIRSSNKNKNKQIEKAKLLSSSFEEAKSDLLTKAGALPLTKAEQTKLEKEIESKYKSYKDYDSTGLISQDELYKNYVDKKLELQDKKSRKIKDETTLEKYKKDLQKKKEEIYKTKNLDKLQTIYDKRGKKYLIDPESKIELNKKYNTLSSIENDWQTLRGLTGKNMLVSGARLIAAPIVGSGLGYLSGKALFDN